MTRRSPDVPKRARGRLRFVRRYLVITCMPDAIGYTPHRERATAHAPSEMLKEKKKNRKRSRRRRVVLLLVHRLRGGDLSALPAAERSPPLPVRARALAFVLVAAKDQPRAADHAGAARRVRRLRGGVLLGVVLVGARARRGASARRTPSASTTTFATSSYSGSTYSASASARSTSARRPRAPVSRLSAARASSRQAPGVNSSSAPPHPCTSFWNCLPTACFGPSITRLSSSSDSERRGTATGKRPTNSGIRPYCTKSIGSTSASASSATRRRISADACSGS